MGDDDGAGIGDGAFRGIFRKELVQMMYGCGDVPAPLDESVDLVEDMAIEFMTSMTVAAAAAAGSRDKVKKDDLLFAIRSHPRMYARARDLLRTNRIIQEFRKQSSLNEGTAHNTGT